MRFFKAFILTGVLGASASTAATVAEYRAFSSISVTITSATYENSGADALAALQNGTWYDSGDAGTSSYGTGQIERTYSGRYQDPGLTTHYNRSSTVTGYASATETSGYSIIAQYDVPAFDYLPECAWRSLDYCSEAGRIVLELDYSLEAHAETTLFDPLTGDASASSAVRLTMIVSDWTITLDRYVYRINAESSRGETQMASLSGSQIMVLAPGQFLGLDLYQVSVAGSASYTAPSPVPLPAGIPLMASGLGLLAWRRKAARPVR